MTPSFFMNPSCGDKAELGCPAASVFCMRVAGCQVHVGSRFFRKAWNQACHLSKQTMSGEPATYSLFFVGTGRFHRWMGDVNRRSPLMALLSSSRGLKPRERSREFWVPIFQDSLAPPRAMTSIRKQSRVVLHHPYSACLQHVWHDADHLPGSWIH